MTHAKIQHYVPKFLLRNFGLGKNDQVWVYDKHSGRSFPTHVKNVASENKFYDFEIDGETFSLESGLSGIESNAKPVIDKILQHETAACLGQEERAMLAAFLAIQLVRTKSFRMQWVDLPRILRRKVESMGSTVALGSQAEALVQEPNANQIKLDATRMILDAPASFGPQFLNKFWFLAETNDAQPFFLGDNPISLQNHVDMAPYGNLGLGVRGIEIYLPLSSNRALVMWCPSLVQKFSDAAETIRSLPEKLIAANIKNPTRMLAIAESLRNGSMLKYEAQNVVNFNSLQIIRSERYIFSSNNDFSLAERMINDHPDIRFGQRFEDLLAKSN